MRCFEYFFLLFFSYFIQSRILLSVAYLKVTNLTRLGILVHCQVLVSSQYLVRLLSQCWITGGHTIHPPIEGMLLPTGIEPTPFRNSASKVKNLYGVSTYALLPWIIPYPYKRKMITSTNILLLYIHTHTYTHTDTLVA